MKEREGKKNKTKWAKWGDIKRERTNEQRGRYRGIGRVRIKADRERERGKWLKFST